jgi:hypothetical protein
MTSCITLEIYGRFGGNCCLRLRSGIWREQVASKRRKIYTGSNAMTSKNSVALQGINSNFITQDEYQSKHTNSMLIHVCNLATSFDLQSHLQTILNHISVGILSGSAHVWNPKNIYRVKIYGIKTYVYIVK